MPDEPPISLTGKVDDLEGPIVKLIQVNSIDANLKQEVFITTVDKARNRLNEAMGNVERRRAWAAPAGILATIAAVFPAATFQGFIFSKDTWRAMFIIAAMLSAAWLVRCLWAKWTIKPQSVDDIIRELRKGSPVPSAASSPLPRSGRY
jgi:hypothetical protein